MINVYTDVLIFATWRYVQSIHMIKSNSDFIQKPIKEMLMWKIAVSY